MPDEDGITRQTVTLPVVVWERVKTEAKADQRAATREAGVLIQEALEARWQRAEADAST